MLIDVPCETGDDLLTKDKTRLWFQTSLRDLPGCVSNVQMTEQAARRPVAMGIQSDLRCVATNVDLK